METRKKLSVTKKETKIQAIKFVLFSISAGLIETVSFTLLNELTDWPYWPSYLTALVLSVLWNFTLNRQFTFKSANNVPVAMLKVFAYYCVFTPVSTIAGNAAAENGVNRYVVLIATMMTNLVTEFLFDKFVVFRGSENTNKMAQREAARKHKRETGGKNEN